MKRTRESSQAIVQLVKGASFIGLAALLGGCDNSQSEQSGSVRVELPMETPAGAQSSPTASILRDDVLVESPVEDLSQSLEVTLSLADPSQFSAKTIEALKEAMASDAMQSGWPITIGGHADSSGSEEVNIVASKKRADAVAAWLLEQGISRDRITIIAFGEQNPILPNAMPDGSPYEAGREANRRVELSVVRPVGSTGAGSASE